MAIKCKSGSYKTVGRAGDQRCMCTTSRGGKRFVSMDRCRASRSAKYGARRSAMRTKSKKTCVAGTLKMRRMGDAGPRCTCKTRAGGTKIVKTSRCK